MKVAFKYEGKTAQIILVPTEAMDDAHLQMAINYNGSEAKCKLGPEKSFIIELEQNGDKHGSVIKETSKDKVSAGAFPRRAQPVNEGRLPGVQEDKG